MRIRKTVVVAALALIFLALGYLAFSLSQDRKELLGRLETQRAETESLQNRFNAALSNAAQASAMRSGELSTRLTADYQELKTKLDALEKQQLPVLSTGVNNLTEGLNKTQTSLAEARQEAATARADLARTRLDLAAATSALSEVKKEIEGVHTKLDCRTIDAEAFNLVDAKGQHLATLASGEAGPALTMFDPQQHNQARLRIGAQAGNAASWGIILRSAGDVPVVSLVVDRDQAHLILAESKPAGGSFHFTVNEKGPRLEVGDNDNHTCLALGIDSDGAYTDLFTADGNKCVSMGVSKEAWGLTITDDKSHAGVMANVVAHKPVLTEFDASGRSIQDTPDQK